VKGIFDPTLFPQGRAISPWLLPGYRGTLKERPRPSLHAQKTLSDAAAFKNVSHAELNISGMKPLRLFGQLPDRQIMKSFMVTSGQHQQLTSAQARIQANAGSPFEPLAANPRELAKITLNDQGIILNCCSTCEKVFGYRQDELKGRHVSALLPSLQDTELVLEERINSRLAFLCHCATPFQARRGDGRSFNSELFINRLGSHNVVVLVRSLEKSK
jgi:PAS domain S-box-containing protein